jgi:cytochrome c peroxidase
VEEPDGGKPEEVAKALAAIPAYAKEFEKAYKAAPAEDTITKALAAFLRTLRSGNSPYDRFMSGKKDALDAKQKAGFDLFMGAAAASSATRRRCSPTACSTSRASAWRARSRTRAPAARRRSTTRRWSARSRRRRCVAWPRPRRTSTTAAWRTSRRP